MESFKQPPPKTPKGEHVSDNERWMATIQIEIDNAVEQDSDHQPVQVTDKDDCYV